MIIGIIGNDQVLVNKIKKIVDNFNISTIILNENSTLPLGNIDLILISGGDKSILDYFHSIKNDTVPVLGVYETDSTGFLAQFNLKDLESIVPRIKKGDFYVDEVIRLAVKVDGREVVPVLNDVAVFPSRSATLMEYNLRINDEDIWHDSSDGIIISTPTGSTAYSMSAGGPMVLQKASVFVVVSVNSVDNTRRPLIVPNDSKLEVTEVMSRYHSEVILDGIQRLNVKKSLECYKHPFPAKLIRLPHVDSTAAMLAKKVKLAEELLNMPPSAKLILKTLEYEGPMSQKDLSSKTMLPERTIRLSLSHLVLKGYVRKKISLRDARNRIYELKI
ncbi:MAG: sugar kinase [Nitrososphaeraceae archaeon]|nr:sugar kinase [Nitrososphaeraceae archaeon]